MKKLYKQGMLLSFFFPFIGQASSVPQEELMNMGATLLTSVGARGLPSWEVTGRTYYSELNDGLEKRINVMTRAEIDQRLNPALPYEESIIKRETIHRALYNGFYLFQIQGTDYVKEGQNKTKELIFRIDVIARKKKNS